MRYPSRLHPEPLTLQQSTADPYLTKYSNTVLSQSLWGPWVLVCTRFVWAVLASLVEMGFDSKWKFAPPTIFLGLLLCPCMWGISSQLLQHLPSYWGFSDLGHGVSPSVIHCWPRRKQQWPHKRRTQTCLGVSRSLQRRRGSVVAHCRLGALSVAVHPWNLWWGHHYLHHLHHSLVPGK